MDVSQMQKRIQELEQQTGSLVKTGEIIYINPVKPINEKMNVIEIGMDCTEIFNGRKFTDVTGFQVSDFDKAEFAAFNVAANTNKYKVGDRIKVILEVKGFAVNTDKKTGLPVIYNNTNLLRCRLISTGAVSAPVAAEAAPAEAAPVVQEEAPW